MRIKERIIGFCYPKIRYVKNVLKYNKKILQSEQVIAYFFKEKQLFDSKGNLVKLEIKKIYEKALKKYCFYVPFEADIVAEHLFTDSLVLEKECDWGIIDKNDPILICNVKNEISRIKLLFEHHRRIGIKHFVILDNESNDGTFEWVMQQNDAEVYSVTEKYNSIVRTAWIMRMILNYGMDRWYLVIDADELLVFAKEKEWSVQELTCWLEENKIFRARGIMIDMYAHDNILNRAEKGIDHNEIEEVYKYCDCSSYFEKANELYPVIFGGPRIRWFGKINNMVEELTKFPLVFCRLGEIVSAHYMYPFFDNFTSGLLVGLKHYKFLPGDVEKYKVNIEEGNYSCGSVFYKKYYSKMKEKQNISFYYKDSVEYSPEIIEVIRRNIKRR